MNDAQLERMVNILDKGIEIQKLSSWNNGLILTRGIFLNFFKNQFIYLFIFGCVGSSFLCEGFL